ncbi:MAG: hypothetical protein ABJ004_11720 [Cyclobacteriaceae bacterium]
MSFKNQVIVMDALHDNFIAKDQVTTPELKKITNLSDDQLNEAVGILFSDGYVNFERNKSFNLTLLTRQHFYKCRSEIKDRMFEKNAIKANKRAKIFKNTVVVLTVLFAGIQTFTQVRNSELSDKIKTIEDSSISDQELINKLQNKIDSLSSELLIISDSLVNKKSM